MTFDRDIDQNTVTADSLFIQKPGSARLPAELTCDRTFATLKTVHNLDPDTVYQVTLTDAVKSVKGASVVGAPITWTFRTEKMPLPFL